MRWVAQRQHPRPMTVLMQGENLVTAGERLGASCVLIGSEDTALVATCQILRHVHIGAAASQVLLNTSRASYQGPHLPFFPMTHLLSSASLWPQRTVALWNLWGLMKPCWVPTSCGPLPRRRALPGNGQLPWLPLGTQPGRAASAPLECISTLGLLGTAVLFSKTASPPKIPD